jgi:hypothetical protein
MKNFLNTKTIIGSLLVAIAGSALWENVFRDVLSFVSQFVLTIATLGLEKYKNDIYINIARGFYEQVSLQILSLSLGVFFGIMSGMALFIFKIKEGDERQKASKTREWVNSHRRFIKVALLTYTFFMIGLLTLSLVKITYINRSIAYYRQLESIALPYLTPEQEKLFNSRFAQIKNREDYVQIIIELNKSVSGRALSLPAPPTFIF